ncbi:MAG: hypothetical protein JSS04_15735 [Proteobacteria bacterium]|nr:hypothetical protein [Pseudomonadota bacterium]
MFSRLLTVALLTAGTALAFSTAQAQTSGTSSGTGSSTMPPKTTTSPSTSSGSSSMGSSGSSSMGSTGSHTSTQQAQQPMSSGSFNAANYKTKTECLNAASAQHADRTLCDILK